MSNAQQDPAAATAPREIAVVAKRFAFEPARIEVVEGERVRLVITSADGVHGLEIKKLDVNKTIPRGGEPVTIDFTAASAGEYTILCSEYCGKQHDDMKGTLVVSAAKPHSPAPARGKDDNSTNSPDGDHRPGTRMR